MTRLVCFLSTAAIFAAMPLGMPRAAEPSPAERFQTITDEAEAHYGAGRFQEAIDSYLRAYDVVPSPDALYNIGYIYETNLRKTDLATDFYRRVVRDPASRADLVKLATGRITSIEAANAVDGVRPKVLEGDPRTRENPMAVGATVSPASETSVVPWVVTGVGGAAIVAGIVVGLQASNKHDDFVAGVGGLEGMRSNADSGKSLAIASDVLWIGGAALATTGLLMWLMEGDDASNPPRAGQVRWSPMAGPDGAGLVVKAGF